MVRHGPSKTAGRLTTNGKGRLTTNEGRAYHQRGGGSTRPVEDCGPAHHERQRPANDERGRGLTTNAGVVRHGPSRTLGRLTTNGNGRITTNGTGRLTTNEGLGWLVGVHVEEEEVVVGGVVGFGAAGEFEGGDG